MTIGTVYRLLDRAAPFARAESWDNAGLLVGSMEDEVRGGITVSLDITSEVIETAIRRGHSLIVAHHPLIWDPLRRIGSDERVYKLIRAGIGAICIHTPLDIAGAFELGRTLGMTGMELLAPTGEADGVPYGFGAVGALPGVGTTDALVERIKGALALPSLRLYDSGRPVRRVAVCGGAGGSFLREAIAAGADAYITGDVKHDPYLEAAEAGITLIDATHHATERPMVTMIEGILREGLPGMTVEIARQRPPLAAR